MHALPAAIALLTSIATEVLIQVGRTTGVYTLAFAPSDEDEQPVFGLVVLDPYDECSGGITVLETPRDVGAAIIRTNANYLDQPLTVFSHGDEPVYSLDWIEEKSDDDGCFVVLHLSELP